MSRDTMLGDSDPPVQFFQWHTSESKYANILQVELGLKYIGTTLGPIQFPRGLPAIALRCSYRSLTPRVFLLRLRTSLRN